MNRESAFGCPHPEVKNGRKKIRARHILPPYDPHKWIRKGILILTTRRPLSRLLFLTSFIIYITTITCPQIWKLCFPAGNCCNVNNKWFSKKEVQREVFWWSESKFLLESIYGGHRCILLRHGVWSNFLKNIPLCRVLK